ncbi:MAG: hypothetical protein AB1792_10065 [Candidatus Zixiibacteriota bacterium]
MSRSGPSSRKAILLLDSGNSRPLVEALASRGITLPVYCDVEQKLDRVHGVAVIPVYFCVNEVGVITEFGVPKISASEFQRLLTR